MIISIAAAISEYNEVAPLGDGRRQWYMPEDLKRFKDITSGHSIIIEAETFKEIVKHLKDPLPDRRNVVIGKPIENIIGVTFVNSLQEAFDLCGGEDEIFLMGNSNFYTYVFPHVNKLYLTIVQGKYNTDEYFPSFDKFNVISTEEVTSNGFNYTFKILTL